MKRSLPVGPRTQKLIVKTIAKEYGLIVSEYIPRTTGLPSETIEIVKNHYLKDAISRTMPEKADTETGDPKPIETKRHLLMTVVEAYALFMADHPDIEIGKSKFLELRPMHVRKCVCQQHSNVILFLDGLYRKIKEIPLYTRQGFISGV